MRNLFDLPRSSVTKVHAAERYISPVGPKRSIRDTTTGLFDPDAFIELAADRLERGLSSSGRVAVAVFQLDLADSQTCEESLGVMAAAIRNSIRPSDLATRPAPCTFIALLDRCDREEAKHVCGRIMRSVMALGIPGSLSCGIAVAPTEASSLDELIAIATRRPAPVRVSPVVAAAS
jgi:GGDEF domain-containing protein